MTEKRGQSGHRYYLRSITDILESSDSDREDSENIIRAAKVEVEELLDEENPQTESSINDKEETVFDISGIFNECCSEIINSPLPSLIRENKKIEIPIPVLKVSQNLTNRNKMADLNYKHAFLTIPKFKGDSESLPQFIRCCELIIKDLKEEEKSKFLGLMNTLLIEKANDVLKFNDFQTWEELKEELETRFSCSKSVSQLQSELLLIKQSQNESIQNFSDKIEMLLAQLNSSCIKAEGKESAKLLQNFNSKLALKSFENGIFENSIKIIVKAGNFSTLREAIRRALEEETIINPCSKNSNSRNRSQSENNSNSTIKCQLCGILGHFANSCRRFNLTPVQNSNAAQNNFANSIQGRTQFNQNPIICHYCKHPGHMIANCKKRQYNLNKNLSTPV